jgi:hypothetical protein
VKDETRTGTEAEMYEIKEKQVEIPEDLLAKWQQVVDLLAELADVPAALIMKVELPFIEVFNSSNSSDNPYQAHEKAPFHTGCGLYCETVIRTKEKLFIPDALQDKDWQNNPDVKLGMISYFGLPILYPDNEIFGTICILDAKENRYKPEIESLMVSFKDIIEAHLSLIVQNVRLESALSEIKALSGMLPICTSCKKIRNDKGYWTQIEAYISEHSAAEFTHSLCPECAKEMYPEFYNDEI